MLTWSSLAMTANWGSRHPSRLDYVPVVGKLTIDVNFRRDQLGLRPSDVGTPIVIVAPAAGLIEFRVPITGDLASSAISFTLQYNTSKRKRPPWSTSEVTLRTSICWDLSKELPPPASTASYLHRLVNPVTPPTLC